MGNRAVITTRENWRHCGVGIYLHWNGNVNINTILGIGEKDKIVNGHDVEGVPYMDYFNKVEGNPANNCNNYLFNKQFRLYKKFIEK